MILIDCHNHSTNSPDADNTVFEMAERAEQAGVSVYAITDHCDVDQASEYDLTAAIAKSLNELEQAKKQVKIKLLRGVELGNTEFDISFAESILNKFEFDMVIGSVHSIKGEKDFYYRMADDDVDVFDMLKRYFEELLRLTESGMVDTIAHINYPFRYIVKYKKYESILPKTKLLYSMAEQVLKSAIKHNVAIEYNTSASGDNEICNQLNRRYLEMYHSLGGEMVTIGADAHDTRSVLYGVEKAYATLKEIGFTSVCYFEKRKPVEVKI